MRKILHIVRTDMKRRLRSPVSVLCMLLIPLGLTLIVGLVFGRRGEVELSRIKVLIVDADKGVASNFVKQGMKQGKLGDLVDLVEVERAEGYSLMDRGKASALIEIPDGFTEKVLDRKPVEISLVKNPRETFLPVIAEEITGTVAVLIESAARVFEEPIADARSLIEANRWPEAADLARLLAGAKKRMGLVRGFVADTLISIRSETVAPPAEEPAGSFNLFAYIMPGSILIGLLFIGEITMREILREKESGTLARVLAGPIESAHVIGGKILSSFAITFVACLLLIAVGRFGFGISWGSPPKLAVFLVGSILMCVGIIAFLYGAIRSQRTADAMLPVVILVICIFGGAMIPFEAMGEGMRRVAKLSPAFWVIDGLKMISIEKAPWSAIVRHLAVVYGIGAVSSAAGAAFLRAKMRGGG